MMIRGLVIKDNSTFKKYEELTDGNIIYYDDDIEGIVIDIEDIKEFKLFCFYEFIKELHPNIYVYDCITIYKEKPCPDQ